MYTYAPVVKMVITSPCHGEGHRFKSGRARQEIILIYYCSAEWRSNNFFSSPLGGGEIDVANRVGFTKIGGRG